MANRKWQMASGKRQTAVLVCGTLIAPLIVQLMDEMAALTGLRVKVLPVVNQFFGPTVTVSGLLAGRDVVAAVKEHALEGPVFLPRTMFDAAGERTLDDWTLKAMESALGVPVIVSESVDRVIEQVESSESAVAE